uniref:T9SS type A sorting domain-containing protein n=1 Tax=candidate division WOR-3 bacterium TaxID=2052148 RepID=A0A7C6ABG3_UNCW3
MEQRSFLTFRLPPTTNRLTLKLFDISGRMIREIATPAGKSEIKIPLKGINPGIYFLQLGEESKKFLIVK